MSAHGTHSPLHCCATSLAKVGGIADEDRWSWRLPPVRSGHALSRGTVGRATEPSRPEAGVSARSGCGRCRGSLWGGHKIPSTVAYAEGGRPSCRRVSESTFTQQRSRRTDQLNRSINSTFHSTGPMLLGVELNSLHDASLGPENVDASVALITGSHSADPLSAI